MTQLLAAAINLACMQFSNCVHLCASVFRYTQKNSDVVGRQIDVNTAMQRTAVLFVPVL